jgi:hypothetical protein
MEGGGFVNGIIGEMKGVCAKKAPSIKEEAHYTLS